mgnify:CR=1 FL=1
MEKLIKNGLIVTMGPKDIVQGYIYIKNGRIEEISDGNPDFKADEEIDASGKIITPGIITAHTHLYGALLRGAPLPIEPPSEFGQNLERVWWNMDEAMSYDQAEISAKIASLKMLLSGSTFFADTYSGPNSIENVLDEIKSGIDEVGIRGMLAFESTERNSKEEGERGLKENKRFLKKISNEEKIYGMVSLHASFTVSNELIHKGKELANKYDVPATIHTSEGPEDLYYNILNHSKRTVERLNDEGFLDENTALAHCVHVNEEELEIIKESGAGVIHNPMSNMLNGVGIADVPKMLDMGINVGIGNDGYIFDPFENIRSSFLLHKVNKRDPRVTNPKKVFEMATIDGAKLYNVDNEIGSLEEDKKADLVIFDPSIQMTPINKKSVYGHIVNSLRGGDAETVIVNGEKLVEDNEPTHLNRKEIENESIETSKDLWKELGAL